MKRKLKIFVGILWIIPFTLVLSSCSQVGQTNQSGINEMSRPTANACQTASDCRGMLPKFCVTCSNGHSGGCAHWSCVQNQCQIKTCDL